MRPFIASTALALVMVSTPLGAETVADIRAEISALSTVVADLARELSSGSAAGQPGFDGSLLERVDQIRDELARLTGRTEEMEFRIRRVVDEASNRLGDLEFRVTELEGGDVSALQNRPLGGDIAAPAPLSPTPAVPQAEFAAGERAAYEGAISLADAGDSEGAIDALRDFLDLFPGSPLSVDAAMRLASLQRDAGAEPDAARTYLNLYLADTEGPSAPPALLGLGRSLGRLAQVEEACVMFDELRDRFGGTTEALEAESARIEIGCP